MPQDPMALFGGLLRSCISDRYDTGDGGLLKEGMALMVLGLASSLLTTYSLATLGLLV
jgi:hypothetical protein